MNSIYKQEFINQIFEKFNQDSISYGILRNYKNLPELSGDDIDIYLDNGQLVDFVHGYLARFLSGLGWSYKLKYDSEYFVSVVCYSVNNNSIETLQLDFFNDFVWRGISYLDIQFIKGTIGTYKQYKVVSPGAELAITYVKEILGYKLLRQKHHKRFEEMYPLHSDDFARTILPAYRKNVGGLIAGLSGDADDDHFKFSLRVIKRSLISKNFVTYISSSLMSIVHLFSKIFRKKQLIVFIGPDGSGKSTLIDNYKIALDRFFPDSITTFHRRYQILPDLKTNRGFSSMKGKIKAGENVKIKRSFISIFFTLTIVFYYTFEFILGNYILFKNKFNGRLVLFDRYYFDHFIQPTSRNLIFPLRKLLLAFVAKPMLIVHLKASSAEIYKRKKDLPENEIAIQNTYIEMVTKGYDNVLQLDSVEMNEKELAVNLFYKTIDDLVFYK